VRHRAGVNLARLLKQSKRITDTVEVLDLEPYEMLSTLLTLETLSASLSKEAAVLVDISTLTKPHVVYVLEAMLKGKRATQLRVAYTRARYGRYDALSWGAEEPIVLPRFGKPRAFSDMGSRLAVFCGLEPERCYSVWRRFGQDESQRYFIDSGEEDVDRCADRAIKFNSYGQEQPKVLRAFAPDEVVAELMTSYRECRLLGKHFYVSPLTTKWEALAVWEFFRLAGQDAEASIVYAAPGRYNTASYTLEHWGATLVADIDMKAPGDGGNEGCPV